MMRELGTINRFKKKRDKSERDKKKVSPEMKQQKLYSPTNDQA
jgi:hypothetical protein